MPQGRELSRLLERAVGFHRAGRLADAERLYADILRAVPADFNARHLLGVICYQQGRHAEALELIGTALKTEPRSSQALANYGLVLRALCRFDEAVASFDRSLVLAPENADILNKRGNALSDMGRGAEALASYDAALKLQPRDSDALNNRGVVLRGLRRLAEALASTEAALAVRPDFAEALNNRGNILRDMKRSEEGLASYDRALQSQPDYVEALSNRGAMLRDLKQLPEALASFDQALAINPNHAEVLFNRGIVLREQRRLAESLASLDSAVAVLPGHAEAFYQRGYTLQFMNRPAEALASFEKALALDPTHACALGGLAGAALMACDWTRMAEAAGGLRSGKSIVPPLTMLSYCDDAELHLECATRYMRNRIGAPPQPLRSPALYRHHDKIRVAYLSTDFKEHATAFLAADLFERHDRSRFEVLGLSIGPDDKSRMRARLARSFDQFHDVQFVSDRNVAELVCRLEVDILVDLNGHTYGYRPEILACRAAPVQVNYLGYPGTMGADFIDYVIADPVVLPRDRQPFYTEKIVHLPDCYQANSARMVAQAAPARGDCGLPGKGFVFCCFNNNWKISAPLFDIWMRLLGSVPDSLLWLLADNEAAQANLRREAMARGIDPRRLVFAARAAPADHLARHHLADLFLDTLPYNAHTTASDALWMGLPLVTCLGECFAGRVAASLLKAAGVPDLVTHTLQEYEVLALKLAREPALLQSFRDRLQDPAGNILFDAGRFRRNIEAAYAKMREIARAGEAPYGFSVAPQTV